MEHNKQNKNLKNSLYPNFYCATRVSSLNHQYPSFLYIQGGPATMLYTHSGVLPLAFIKWSPMPSLKTVTFRDRTHIS